MAREIERKFLVAGEGWRSDADAGASIRQGYITRTGAASVRVRIIDGKAYLTVKSTNPGLVRTEFEYAIPMADAERLLADACEPPLIEKTRHTVRFGAHDWSVDVFGGALAGLTIAEVELAAPDEAVEIPPWAAREVTDDPRYRNEALGAGGPAG
ncbi:MAG: CYTH domain-containing protein [Alphaproteobacteria bacterium]|nr:CYTH domain-containing protein [Alphaproteobacteria bacterium]